MTCSYLYVFFFFKQKTAYEMRISDWSSDVCSSDLAFDIFILSDSTDPEIHDAERLAFERLREHCPVRLYYRRRAENIERKPGNIAESVRRFGGAYAYMIVLVADRLMRGRAMLPLSPAMESHPKVGLLQAVPVVAGCSTLLDRTSIV